MRITLMMVMRKVVIIIINGRNDDASCNDAS